MSFKVLYHSESNTMTGKWRVVKAHNLAYFIVR